MTKFVGLRGPLVSRRAVGHVFVLVVVVALFAGTAAAGNGMTLSKQTRDTLTVPRWLYLATGAAAIGASGLLSGFVTDRAFIRSIHEWSRPGPTVRDWWRVFTWLGRGIGLLVLGLVIYFGFTGPQLPAASLAVLVTFVLVRAGLPMVTYLGGNVWPLLNPWRLLVAPVPTGFVRYPDRLHRWPAVGGLLGIVWMEVFFPLSTVPRVLSMAIVGYTVYTVAGAILFGPAAWYDNADPLSVLFRFFGAVAPLQRRDDGLSITLPGNELADSNAFSHESDVAFVIALIWELTYSGFITTETGAATIEAAVRLPIAFLGTQARASLVYTGLLVGGFAIFAGAYWYASVLSRRYTGTYVTARHIALRFAPPLLAIAAGYHLAHYVSLVVSLSPALGMVITSPLSPPANPITLAPPGWFDGLNIGFVLVGHVLAIWAAHATAYEVFASRLVAIRSQYPFIAVMIGYTVISLWILSLPGAIPPYLP
ncbi:MAG: hypothetical protein U5K70_08535 [Halodesulfurarchaeum sp.]|nr:hypothetical protein [Halodesulfurarchaeum sp.]